VKLIHWTLVAFFLSVSGPLYAQESATEESNTEEAAEEAVEETKDNADKAMTDLEKAEAAKKAEAKKKAEDAKKAKKKAEGDEGTEKPAEEVAATQEAPATVEPVVEAAPAAEVAPVTAAASTDVTADATATVDAEEEEKDKKPKKPWGVSLSLGHSVSAGSFQANPYLRDQVEYAGQSWGLSGRYSFKVMDVLPLSASASVSLSVPLVDPQAIDDRRVRFGNTSFGLSAPVVYKDEWSGINVSAGLGYSAPTAITNWYANKNYGGLSGRVGLSRSFGDFSVSLGMSLSHTMYASNVGQSLNTSGVSAWNNVASHCTQEIVGETTAAAQGDTIQAAINGMNTVYQCEQGSGRTFLSLGNKLGLSYKITDLLSVSYSLGFSNSFKYSIVSEADQYTNPGSSTATPSMALDERDSSDNTQWVDGGESGVTTNGAADTGVGLRQRFSTGLSLSFGLSKGIKEWVELPFSLSMSASIATSHAAQKQNGDLFLPLFYNSFGDNQSANSYGSISFGLSGSY
jgi:chemotaxis protein histidine kinase CheA